MWKKENQIFCRSEELERAYNEGYMFFADGIFDKLIVEYLGYPAASFMGSHVSEFHKDLLRNIKHPILLTDSDSAGRKLFKRMQAANPNTIEFRMISEFDDIYDYLVDSPERALTFKNVFEESRREGFSISKELY